MREDFCQGRLKWDFASDVINNHRNNEVLIGKKKKAGDDVLGNNFDFGLLVFWLLKPRD